MVAAASPVTTPTAMLAQLLLLPRVQRLLVIHLIGRMWQECLFTCATGYKNLEKFGRDILKTFFIGLQFEEWTITKVAIAGQCSKKNLNDHLTSWLICFVRLKFLYNGEKNCELLK